MNHCIIYSCHIKKGKKFTQAYKENTYIALLTKIVSSIEENISIIFDSFNKTDFEQAIVERMLTYPHVQAVMPRDSQKEAGLQFVDNICSVIRMKRTGNDKYNYFKRIEKWVVEA